MKYINTAVDKYIIMDLSTLSKEQKYALDLFKRGENVFLSGPGGTGKTKLIECFVQHCVQHNIKHQVCALTGCATILLPKMCNARTIHSWSGIRLCKGENAKIVENALKYKKNKSNWKSIRVLIIDEVSMMSLKVFNVLNEIAKRAQFNSTPFGGIQVVFVGDFYQLPPVSSQEDVDSEKFCFESPLWSQLFPLNNVVLLKTIFRQDDPKYKEILLQIRESTLTAENSDLLETYVNREFDPSKYNGIVPTKLYPTRYKTEQLNEKMFSQLKGKCFQFQYIAKLNCKTHLDSNQPLSVNHLMKCSNISQQMKEFEVRQLMNSSSYPDILYLKVGAVVMCTINLDMDNGICNGSQGIITNILETAQGPVPEVTFVNGIKKQISIQYRQSEDYPSIAVGQIPLTLAWALTIHKIQGATLNMATIDVGSQIFECGQTYVALSRVKSLDGLYLSAFNSDRIKTNAFVKSFYDSIPHKEYDIPENIFKSFELSEDSYEESTVKKIIL